jgi:mRNA interferase MazF
MTTNSTPLISKLLPIRGDVWLVEFDPVKGDEIRKSRPAIVISSDAFKPLKTKLVVPLTSWQEKFAISQWMVKIVADAGNGLDHDSAADALQLRCVSYERFTLKLGMVSAPVLDEIAAAIAVVIEFQ